MLTEQEREITDNTKGSFGGFFRGIYYLTIAKYTAPDKHKKAKEMLDHLDKSRQKQL